MINVNDFKGIDDNSVIENAIKSKTEDKIIVIPPRVSEIEPERNWWLLDRAILLPENTTVILENCTIKLSDRCRDNFFRTDNCGMGIEAPEKIQNIHIRGVGNCVLQGADHPRSTGDSSKILTCPCPYDDEDLIKLADWIPADRKESGKLTFWDKHIHSYGTDAGKEGESQHGDWRNIGILFANVENFSIENITIRESHGWAISLEECCEGRVEKIKFDACMSKMIDGMRHNIENQDGVDIRNGCHNIIISDITGRTGDDVVALTAIATDNYEPGGSLKTTHVMHSDWSRRDKNIHDIIIKNVSAYSNLCFVVRLLPGSTKIWNVVIDGVIDTAPDDKEHFGAILLGEPDGAYGSYQLSDGMKNIIISNVIANSQDAIVVDGYINDSVISNIINRKPGCETITLKRRDGLKNVKVSNVCSAE